MAIACSISIAVTISGSIALTCLDEAFSYCLLFKSNFLFDIDICLDVLGPRGLLTGLDLAVTEAMAT